MQDIPLQAVMTEVPLVAYPSTTVGAALQLLADMEIRHLPVVEEDKLIGILSDRDLLAMYQSAESDADPLEQPVTAIMSAQVVTVDTSEDAAAAASVMLEYRVGAVPVVDAESGTLVGIVSYVDLLRAALQDRANSAD